MLFSESFIFTLREDPRAAECRSLKFLLKGCFLTLVSSGVYAYLPLGYRVLNKINNLIRRNMDAQGAQEILMSVLQPLEIWAKTGRDQDLKEVMFRLKDRKRRQLCLGPTHEEEITEIVRHYVSSHRQLPLILYQIQTKFRDEPRPRCGLLRSCEFIMKDAYSFDRDTAGLAENYQKMLTAYDNIFRGCELDFVKLEADPGAMGGSVSHEFMVPSEIGEDSAFYCPGCQTNFSRKGLCPGCGNKLEEKKMIEVGHIFQLGTKYSRAQEAFFLDPKGERKPLIMGCYGIGVSRVLAAIAEVNSDAKGLVWPKEVSPYDVSLVVLDKQLFDAAAALGQALEKRGITALIDDRDEAAGVKFNDAYLIGNPYILILGKNYLKSRTVDLEIRRTQEKKSFSQEAVLKFLSSEYGRQ